MWLVHVILNQSCVQRIVSLPTLSHARRYGKIGKIVFNKMFYNNCILFSRALSYFCLGVIFIMGINIITGIIMFAYYHNCDPVQAQVNKNIFKFSKSTEIKI